MTPALTLAKKKNIIHTVHSYEHDPNAASYGLEAVDKLGLNAQHVFKTLVVVVEGKGATDKQLVVAVLPVAQQLNMKAIAKAAGAKKATMADPVKVQRTTGYVLGGVSPLGQKKRLATFIDGSAESLTRMFVSAGKRGLEIELSPQDLAKLTDGRFAVLTEV